MYLGISLLIQLMFFLLAASFRTDKVTDLSYGLSFFVIALVAMLRGEDVSLVKLIAVGMVTIWSARLASYLLIRVIIVS